MAYDFPETRFDDVLDALLPYGPTVVCVMHSPADAIAPAIERSTRAAADSSARIPRWPATDASQSGTASVARGLAAYAVADQLGAQILGGCCGTTPEQIVRALRAGRSSERRSRLWAGSGIGFTRFGTS